MTSLQPGLHVRIEVRDRCPELFPLSSGFSAGQAYRTLGLYNTSETSEAYFVLRNDRDEIWFICKRHDRANALLPDKRVFALPVFGTVSTQMAQV